MSSKSYESRKSQSHANYAKVGDFPRSLPVLVILSVSKESQKMLKSRTGPTSLTQSAVVWLVQRLAPLPQLCRPSLHQSTPGRRLVGHEAGISSGGTGADRARRTSPSLSRAPPAATARRAAAGPPLTALHGCLQSRRFTAKGTGRSSTGWRGSELSVPSPSRYSNICSRALLRQRTVARSVQDSHVSGIDIRCVCRGGAMKVSSPR